MAFPAGVLAQVAAASSTFAGAVTLAAAGERRSCAGNHFSDVGTHGSSFPADEKIKISYGSGPWEHCRFGGATDAYLYCEPGEDRRAAGVARSTAPTLPISRSITMHAMAA